MSTSFQQGVELPAALLPLVNLLYSFNDNTKPARKNHYAEQGQADDDNPDALTDDQKLAILFLVRLGDAMHAAGYATFLTLARIHELAHVQQVPRNCAGAIGMDLRPFPLPIKSLPTLTVTRALNWDEPGCQTRQIESQIRIVSNCPSHGSVSI